MNQNKSNIALIITVDYETWHAENNDYEQIFEKYHLKIDWEKDIIANAYKLMDCAEKLGIKLTFMIEMCEYIWLKENNAIIAEKIAHQIQDIVIRGHDVQLHTHPHWMPETGAKFLNGKWIWNCEFACPENYPGNLDDMISVCKRELENIVQRVKPEYKVTCFRSGTYLVQPFRRLSKALMKNNIFVDSSVFRGGYSTERGYNFKKCKYANGVYHADLDNPAIEDNSSSMYEVPIFAYHRNRRWSFDYGQPFGNLLLLYANKYLRRGKNVFVMVGHTKTIDKLDTFSEQINLVKKHFEVSWCTLGELNSKIELCELSEETQKVKLSKRIGAFANLLVYRIKRKLSK